MMQDPAWESPYRQEYPALRGSRTADVVVIGGGLTGVNCAAMLAGSGAKVALLEARRLGQGASAACTGKLTCQHPQSLTLCARAVSEEAAAVYAQLLREAVEGVRRLVERFALPCDLRENRLLVYAEQAADARAVDRLHALEARLSLPVSLSPGADGLPFPAARSAALPGQALLSPLRYLLALAEAAVEMGCEVYETTAVRAIDGGQVFTAGGTVQADSIILATGSPAGCKSLSVLASLKMRTCAARVVHGPTAIEHSYLSIREDSVMLRPVPGGMLLSYDLSRTGTSHTARLAQLDRVQSRLLPHMTEAETIIRQDFFPVDGLPLIGALKPENGRVLIATGYGGWGLTNSFLAARLLTRQILGTPMPEARFFRPFRRYPGHALHLMQGGLPIAGAYAAGLLRPGAPVCPHMGGRLRYSEETRRWECPCHGSAFTVMGEVLDAPALRPADARPSRR